MSDFWKKRRCLVTGGAGFGGSHLCEALLKEGARVFVYDRCLPRMSYLVFKDLVDKVQFFQGDVNDLEFLKTVISRYDIEILFHLAAQPIKPKSNDIPYETMVANGMGTFHVLEAVRTTKERPSLIFASTGGYYGTCFSEDLIPEDTPPNVGDNVYSATKAAGDIAVRYYANIYGIQAAACRFMQTYGPGDTQFSRLIPITVKYLMNGERARISRCDGTPTWDFMHVRDMAWAYMSLAQRIDRVSGEAFNFGGGEPISVKEMVKLITAIFTGKEMEPEILMEPTGVLQKTCLDISKARTLLGWEPRISLEEGLKETIAWYREIWDRVW